MGLFFCSKPKNKYNISTIFKGGIVMLYVIKRNKQEVPFDISKIRKAIQAANLSVPENKRLTEEAIEKSVKSIECQCKESNHSLDVEEIQDFVEKELMNSGAFEVAQSYIRYRYKRMLSRQMNTTDEKILTLVDDCNEEAKQENSNKNPTRASTQRDYIAGEVSRDITERILLPDDVVKAHKEGIIHFHDSDYYINRIYNCCLINIEDMLQNGTVISGTKIEKPHSFSTACNITSQIIAQVASSQYGGQSITLSHLAPFVEISRQKVRKETLSELDGLEYSQKKFEQIVEAKVKKEVERGVQTLQYQILTLLTTNGQAPFVTLFMYLNEVPEGRLRDDLAMIIEEVIRQRYEGVKNEKGVWITPAFPKLIYVLEENNIKEGTKYWYLTELAAKCTAKRMVPDYISEKIMLQNKIDKNGEGHCYSCMGCRSFLTPYIDENGKPKYYGRFNQGVVTINLVDAGLSANHNLDTFWNILDERLELCHKALRCRHERLLNTKSDIAPILWQYGAIARLKKGEVINKYLFGGYSTISLGYAGLWECVYSLIGKKLTEAEGEALGIKIMKKLNEYTNKWKEEENIDYSLYGTPLESTTYKFAKCLQKRFGMIKNVTDKNYITNSYHIHVTEPINAFDKLSLEAKFQSLSPGGAISYVEVPNMQNNIEAVLSVMKFIYDNIMYAELNTKSDYCQVCGYDGEISIVEENGKLIWKCPNCGNEDKEKLNVARRTCGYIGTQFWNQGRTQEIKERVLHL